MPTLRSGLVPAAVYAVKLRRAIFAQLRDHVKKDKEFSSKVAYYAATLNRALFTLLVEELKIDKLDVVRISVDYDLDEASKSITWKWDTLKIEVYRRVPPETYEEALKKFIVKAPELSVGTVKYSVTKLGETFDEDLVYAIKIDEKEVGAASILQVDENTLVLKKAAVVEPTPAVFDKLKLDLAGRSAEEVLAEQLGRVMQVARHVTYDEVYKIINSIREKVSAKPIEKLPEIEPEE
ncbi:MAG: DUF2258 domain-containing protein [Desulfurococcaceae archaeon]